MRYRAVCTITWDFAAECTKDEALEAVRQELERFPIDGKEKPKLLAQVEVLKSKTDRIKLFEVDIEDFMSSVSSEPCKKTFHGCGRSYPVKMNVDRYRLFQSRRDCVACGLTGSKVFLECNPADMVPHFNMYGEHEGELVLFTKDHIVAKAFGGEDRLDNYQTMCCTCNSLKAHHNLGIAELKKLRSLYDAHKTSLPKRRLHVMLDEARNSMCKPWPGSTIKDQGLAPGPNQAMAQIDLAIKRVGDDLVAGEWDGEEGSVYRIEKGALLEVAVEINDECCCMLSDGHVARFKKSYLGRR